MADKQAKGNVKEQRFYKTIGNRLSQVMKAKSVNQLMLEEMSGVSQSTISRILNGTDKPNLYKFVLICDALEIKPEEILSGDQSSYDRAKVNKSAFIVDATHDKFNGYLGDYYAYFYSTVNKGAIHDGIFHIYKDRSSKECLVSFEFDTGEKSKNGKPKIKNFIGKARLSKKLGALCCEMVDKDNNSGDVSYIIFKHEYLINRDCESRMGMVVTICAGLSRLPVAHKLLICRRKLSKEDLYYIRGQLKLNDDIIHVSEELYKEFTKDDRLPESFRRLVDNDKDILMANADKQMFYTLNEDDIENRKDISEEDKAKGISLLRQYSNSKRCKKVGDKCEKYVFNYIKAAKKNDEDNKRMRKKSRTTKKESLS